MIGVTKYRSEGNSGLSVLPNACKDAELLSRTLHEKLGWTVETVLDPDRNTMEAAVTAFAKRVRGSGEVCLFGFAGHGLELAGKNFLLPADFQLKECTTDILLLRHVERTSMGVDDVQQHLLGARPDPADSQVYFCTRPCSHFRPLLTLSRTGFGACAGLLP